MVIFQFAMLNYQRVFSFTVCSWLIGSFVFDACVFVSTLSGIRLKALSWPCAKSHWSGCNQRPKPRSDWGQSWTFPKASCHTVHMLDCHWLRHRKTKKNTMRPKGKTIHGEDKSNSKRLNSNDNGIHYNPTIMAFAKPSQTWPTCRRLFGSVPMTHRFAPRLGKSDLISVGKSEYVICWFTPSPSFTAFFGSHGPLHASGYTWIHPLRVCRVQWCPKNDQSSQVECPHLNHCTTAPRIQERSPRQLLK